MINRLIIRIKVLQLLYNYYKVDGLSKGRILEILDEAIKASYRLYITLCGLPLELAFACEARLAVEEEKFVRDENTISLLRNLLNNPLLEYIRSDESFMQRYYEGMYAGRNLDTFHHTVLNYIIQDEHSLCRTTDWNDFESVRLAWRHLYGKYYMTPRFEDVLQELSSYLNDDILVIFSFVKKVYNQITPELEYNSMVRPMYRNPMDAEFGKTLLLDAIEKGNEYRDIISQYLRNWDRDRVSEIDFIIMQLALTEYRCYPRTIPPVIINEYLDFAHYYSTPKSNVYINGILNELFADHLKKD